MCSQGVAELYWRFSCFMVWGVGLAKTQQDQIVATHPRTTRITITFGALLSVSRKYTQSLVSIQISGFQSNSLDCYLAVCKLWKIDKLRARIEVLRQGVKD